MAKIEDMLLQMKRKPKGVRYTDLCKICDYYFHEKDETINITVEVKPLEELPDELSWEDFIEVPIDDITKAHERKD